MLRETRIDASNVLSLTHPCHLERKDFTGNEIRGDLVGVIVRKKKFLIAVSIVREENPRGI